MAYQPEFAELIVQALTRLDRSPAWLAQRLGVNPSTVSRWLNQSGRPADPETVVRVADILGL
ncbi:MAG: helix-turn-helix transcriptional regulator, partial [Caldilineaceae bacterium]